jgi:beta-galactosidase
MRLWTYRSIAHGASGINYFRWRTARWGQEEYWHGVLPHSGQANRRYTELQQTGEELERIGATIAATRPQAQVAIVMSYESRWALTAISSTQVLSSLFGNDELDVHEEAKAYHSALMERNITTDALDPREDLSSYRLVIAPRLYVMDERVAANLRRFVENGGVLCLTPRSGVADEYNVIFDRPAPGPLLEAAGIEIGDYTTLEAPVEMRALSHGPVGIGRGTVWADEINLKTARTAAQFESGWLAGMPAITVNRFGKGALVYVGTLLRGENLDVFTTWLTGLAGVEPCMATPPGVRAYERRSADYRLVFLLNFSEQPQTVALGGVWHEQLSGEAVEHVHLSPAGVAVIKK